jgi:RHS repeat-associated protein
MITSSRIVSIREGDDFGDTTPAIKYTLEDYLGSSVLELKDDGANIKGEEYYPFGETSFGSYEKKRYKYQGKERDEESGLYYFGARYYSSWTCKFVSVDKVVQPQQSSYCGMDNNPINKIDPTGKMALGTEPVTPAPNPGGGAVEVNLNENPTSNLAWQGGLGSLQTQQSGRRYNILIVGTESTTVDRDDEGKFKGLDMAMVLSSFNGDVKKVLGMGQLIVLKVENVADLQNQLDKLMKPGDMIGNFTIDFHRKEGGGGGFYIGTDLIDPPLSDFKEVGDTLVRENNFKTFLSGISRYFDSKTTVL